MFNKIKKDEDEPVLLERKKPGPPSTFDPDKNYKTRIYKLSEECIAELERIKLISGKTGSFLVEAAIFKIGQKF